MMKYELPRTDWKSRLENGIPTLGDCCFPAKGHFRTWTTGPCASGRLVTAWHSEALESMEK